MGLTATYLTFYFYLRHGPDIWWTCPVTLTGSLCQADRVDSEGTEDHGLPAGCSVRFESAQSRPGGSVLIYTDGVLLKKLEAELIVDEIHEMDVNSDFLLKEDEFPVGLIDALLEFILCLNIGGAVLVILPGWTHFVPPLKHLQEHPLFGGQNYRNIPLDAQLPKGGSGGCL